MKLSEALHPQAILPLLAGQFPSLAYSAGRLDGWSDVIGYDTPMSIDQLSDNTDLVDDIQRCRLLRSLYE